MKILIPYVLFIVISRINHLRAQQIDSLGFEIFEYKDQDSIYVIQKYFLTFLKRGAPELRMK